MLVILKKKNFYNSFYILFFLLIIIFNKFSTTEVKANSYKIENLQISKPYNNNFDKKIVIDSAFTKAFEILIYRITTLDNKEVKKLINLKKIYELVESFSIIDEKFINSQYISNFNVEFNKKNLFNFLEKKNIFPSIPKEKTLLLIPILINIDDKQALLFSENLFYKNWNKFEENYFLLKYILPNEDIEDINFIKKNINNIEEYNFKEIISKYAIEDYIILILFQKKNKIKILSKTNLNNNLIITNKSFEIQDTEYIEKIIKKLKIEFENQWKKLNIINVSIKLPITLKVNSENYNLINILEKKLYDLDLVSSYYVDSFSSEEVIFKVIYNGTPDRFISDFYTSGLKLNTESSIWSIE